MVKVYKHSKAYIKNCVDWHYGHMEIAAKVIKGIDAGDIEEAKRVYEKERKLFDLLTSE